MTATKQLEVRVLMPAGAVPGESVEDRNRVKLVLAWGGQFLGVLNLEHDELSDFLEHCRDGFGSLQIRRE